MSPDTTRVGGFSGDPGRGTEPARVGRRVLRHIRTGRKWEGKHSGQHLLRHRRRGRGRLLRRGDQAGGRRVGCEVLRVTSTVVGPAPRGVGPDVARMLDVVRRLAGEDFAGRRVGSIGGRAAALWLADQMTAAGAHVMLDEFTVDGVVREVHSTPQLVIVAEAGAYGSAHLAPSIPDGTVVINLDGAAQLADAATSRPAAAPGRC